MATRAPAPFSAVIVSWEDAASQGSDQYDTPSSALHAYKPTLRRSIGFWVGYAVKDGRECAVVATDDDRSEESPHALGGTFHIPKGMILSVEPLRIAPVKKKSR